MVLGAASRSACAVEELLKRHVGEAERPRAPQEPGLLDLREELVDGGGARRPEGDLLRELSDPALAGAPPRSGL